MMCSEAKLGMPMRSILLMLGFVLLNCSSTCFAQQCVTTAVPPVFGTYRSSGSGNDVNGTITVSCSVLGTTAVDINYSIKLELSGNAQGIQRQMVFGNEFLKYNLYCDAGRSQVWADGANSTCTILGGQTALLGTRATVHSLYGRIPGGQYVAAGAYFDSLLVQILY
jgi:spore coat protein U-like protein